MGIFARIFGRGAERGAKIARLSAREDYLSGRYNAQLELNKQLRLENAELKSNLEVAHGPTGLQRIEVLQRYNENLLKLVVRRRKRIRALEDENFSLRSRLRALRREAVNQEGEA